MVGGWLFFAEKGGGYCTSLFLFYMLVERMMLMVAKGPRGCVLFDGCNVRLMFEGIVIW